MLVEGLKEKEKEKLKQRENQRQAWQDRLDNKLKTYYGTNIFLNLAEGRVGSLADLKSSLAKYEFDSVILPLRQACLDYEYLVNNGGNPPNPGIFNFKYPMYIGFGNGDNRKHGLIQILI